MRRLYIAGAVAQSGSLLEKLIGVESDLVKHADKVQLMSQELQQGAYPQVLLTYNSLPESLQKEKSFMIIQMQAAMRIDEKVYAESMQKFRKLHPKDACLDMISIDYFILQKNYPEALACVERLDKAVGGDPYLNVLRCGAHVASGEYDTAVTVCERSIAQSPEFIDLYWTRINVSLQQKKFDQTVTWLNRIKQQFNLEFNDLTKLPDYAAFVKSPEYIAWKAAGN